MLMFIVQQQSSHLSWLCNFLAAEPVCMANLTTCLPCWQESAFTLHLAHVGPLERLSLATDGAAWLCDLVVVQDQHQQETVFFLCGRSVLSLLAESHLVEAAGANINNQLLALLLVLSARTVRSCMLSARMDAFS